MVVGFERPREVQVFGSPQVLFAVESMIDDIAWKLRIDPMELREENTLRPGSRTSTDHLIVESVGAPETLARVKESSHWKDLVKECIEFNRANEDKKRGAGLSHIFYGVSLGAGGQALDKSGAREILVEEVPAGEAWDAVRDRLRRAASAENVVTVDPDIAALRADFGEDSGVP